MGATDAGRGTRTSLPDGEAIRRELVALAREDPGRGLLQFGGRVAARQYRPVHTAMRRFVPPGASVLDWGAGNGHFTYFLLRAGYRATAFAISDGGFSKWLPSGDWRFVPGDASEPIRLPFEDASFDAVTSIGVLEHVHESGGDDRASLAELARVLRPGGVFVACHLPNEWSWIEFAARRRPGSHTHDVRYRPGDVSALLAGAGLEPECVERYGILPRNLWSRAPGVIGDAAPVVAIWDGLDAVLGSLLPPLCQNFLVVARKPKA